MRLKSNNSLLCHLYTKTQYYRIATWKDTSQESETLYLVIFVQQKKDVSQELETLYLTIFTQQNN